MDQTKQAELHKLIKIATIQLREYNQSPIVHQLQGNTIFALGAQFLYFGQALTEISNWKMEPASPESRLILSKVVELMEMKTINPQAAIGANMVEPEHIKLISEMSSLLSSAGVFLGGSCSDIQQNLFDEIEVAIEAANDFINMEEVAHA